MRLGRLLGAAPATVHPASGSPECGSRGCRHQPRPSRRSSCRTVAALWPPHPELAAAMVACAVSSTVRRRCFQVGCCLLVSLLCMLLCFLWQIFMLPFDCAQPFVGTSGGTTRWRACCCRTPRRESVEGAETCGHAAPAPLARLATAPSLSLEIPSPAPQIGCPAARRLSSHGCHDRSTAAVAADADQARPGAAAAGRGSAPIHGVRRVVR